MIIVLRKSTERPELSVSRAIAEDLKEEVEDGGVRLLHLVEQQHGERLAALLLGELRKQGRLAEGVFELAHIEPDELSLAPKRYSASVLASSVLPTPVGPTKKSTPSGRVGSVISALMSVTMSATVLTASVWPITRSSK